MCPELSIIIPSKNDQHVERFLDSLARSQPDYLEKCCIYIADDGLSENFKSRVQEVEYVECEKPFCFARNVNKAVARAHQDNPTAAILIQNDDTEILSSFFIDRVSFFLPTMLHDNWALISSRISGNCGNREIQRRTQSRRLSLVNGGETIPFVSVVITDVAWKMFGPLDERFIHYGWEDVAFCVKVKAAGYKMGWTSDLKVFHEGNATYKQFGPERLETMSRASRSVFAEHYTQYQPKQADAPEPLAEIPKRRNIGSLSKAELVKLVPVPSSIKGMRADIEADTDLIWSIIRLVQPDVCVLISKRQTTLARLIAIAISDIQARKYYVVGRPQILGGARRFFMQQTADAFLGSRPKFFRMDMCVIELSAQDDIPAILRHIERLLMPGGCVLFLNSQYLTGIDGWDTREWTWMEFQAETKRSINLGALVRSE